MDLFGADDDVIDDGADDDFAAADAMMAEIDAQQSRDGLLPARSNLLCFGHEAVERKLLDAFNAGRMPHGLILSGPKGIGKSTFAFRLARFLLSQKAQDPNQGGMFGDDLPAESPENMDIPSDSNIVSRVTSGGIGDLMVVERQMDEGKKTQKNALDVDQIRKVIPFLRMTSSEGGWRVVIVDDADTMNRNAQNALLKVLEEPPKNTILILVVHRAGAMLPTIQSRTQSFAFNPLSGENMRTLLLRAGVEDEQEQDVLCRIGRGSIGRALNFHQEGGPEILKDIMPVLKSLPQMSYATIHQLSDQLGGFAAGNNYALFCEIMTDGFQNLLFNKARDKQKLEGVFDFMSDRFTLESLMVICDELKAHFARTDRGNLDKRLSVMQAFEIIRRAA